MNVPRAGGILPQGAVTTASFVMCRYKFNTAHIFDSAAAYFGSDNIGLCGIAWYFKVRIITHTQQEWLSPYCSFV